MSAIDIDFDDLVDFKDSSINGSFNIRMYLQKVKMDHQTTDNFKKIYDEIFAINGTAAVLNISSINDLLNSMEECSRLVYLHRITFSKDILECFLDCCDRIEDILEYLEDDLFAVSEYLNKMNEVEVSDLVLYLKSFIREAGVDALTKRLNQNSVDQILDDLDS